MRFCAEPNCPERVEKGRCPTHTRARERTRGTPAQRGYGDGWPEYSVRFRATHPVCGMRAGGTLDARLSRCVQRGLTTPSACVDHIVPMSAGGSKWDETNHCALCLECNSWKAATLDRGPG
jgi:5-methylcytosine-specific restriction endonuclease McrA